MNIYKLENEIQPYSWGSPTAIPELLNIQNRENTPMAELWMGTHPKAPSKMIIDGEKRSLLKEIENRPKEILGDTVASRFKGKLPFLFKILSASKPLSIQAHPNKEQAEKGFARENKKGIPIDARERNYRDENHKPEVICAVTPFHALRGFRPIEEIVKEFSSFSIPEFDELVRELKKEPDADGLKTFFRKLMELDEVYREELIKRVLEASADRSDKQIETVRMIKEEYPGDIGVLCPLFLNVIELNPGKAMFLPAGELHAYLGGTGIELMANSDNVLRGGLTSKHIDIPELLHVLTFSTGYPEILSPPSENGVRRYTVPIDEYVLTKLSVTGDIPYKNSDIRSVEIMICLEGEGTITEQGAEKPLSFTKGDSFIVFAACAPYTVTGNTVLYKAHVPVSLFQNADVR